MKSYRMNPIDVQNIVARMYANVREFEDKNIQTMFQSNCEAVTLEFSYYSCKAKRMRTLSVTIFPGQVDEKMEFVNRLIDRLKTEDPYEVIGDSTRLYNEKYVF